MPRYFFHVHNHIVAEDEEGTAFPDLNAAREHALIGARDLVCESIRQGHLNLNHYIRISNDEGQDLLEVRFRETFTIEGLG